MIAAVCANPCVDRTVSIERFQYGGMNRILASREDGSSKGVNVAVACAQVGLDAVCLGFMPEDGNGLILDRLRNAGCETGFITYPGAVRVNTKMLDLSTGVATEINASGPAVASADVEKLVELAVRWSRRCSFLVLAGSTPPGCPKNLYATVIREVRKASPSCRVALDAEGERLAAGIEEKPFLVKPNRYELELLCGRPLAFVEDIHAEATGLTRRGIAVVAVSLGGEGAYITDGDQAYYAPALEVPVRSAVGAGDSMVAGMLLALDSGLPLEQVFRYGMAAAASSVTTEGTGLIDRALFLEYIPKIDVRQVG